MWSMHATLHTSFKVKGQGHKLTSSVCKVSSLPLLNSGNKMLYLAIGGRWGIPCWANPATIPLVLGAILLPLNVFLKKIYNYVA